MLSCLKESLYERCAIHPSSKEKGLSRNFVKPIDIDDNPVLRNKYNDDVPVVSFNNEILFCHFIDEKRLRRAIMILNG